MVSFALWSVWSREFTLVTKIGLKMDILDLRRLMSMESSSVVMAILKRNLIEELRFIRRIGATTKRSSLRYAEILVWKKTRA